MRLFILVLFLDLDEAARCHDLDLCIGRTRLRILRERQLQVVRRVRVMRVVAVLLLVQVLLMFEASLHIRAGSAVAGRPLTDGAARRGLGAGRVAVVVLLRVLLRRRRGDGRRRLRAQKARARMRMGCCRNWGVLRSEGGHLLLKLVLLLLLLLRAVETAIPRESVKLSLVAALSLVAPGGPVVHCVEDHAAIDKCGPGTACAGILFRATS